MSRYLLIPVNKQGCNDVNGKLLPMEKFNEQAKEVDVFSGLLVPPPKGVGLDVCGSLMMRLAKTPVGRSKDGYVTDGGKETDVKYDDALRDISNGIFLDKYERFYCILREHGITF